jgi:hypothetical protein
VAAVGSAAVFLFGSLRDMDDVAYMRYNLILTAGNPTLVPGDGSGSASTTVPRRSPTPIPARVASAVIGAGQRR